MQEVRTREKEIRRYYATDLEGRERGLKQRKQADSKGRKGKERDSPLELPAGMNPLNPLLPP